VRQKCKWLICWTQSKRDYMHQALQLLTKRDYMYQALQLTVAKHRFSFVIEFYLFFIIDS
jgi:hypothetical protein